MLRHLLLWRAAFGARVDLAEAAARACAPRDPLFRRLRRLFPG